jgi:hypothetical protein
MKTVFISILALILYLKIEKRHRRKKTITVMGFTLNGNSTNKPQKKAT